MLVASLVWTAPCPSAHAETVVQAAVVPKILLTAQRNKSTQIKGGDWDDKMEILSLDVKVQNQELAKSFENLTAKYWVFARSLKHSKTYRLVIRGEKTFSLSSKEPDRKISFSTEEVTLKWDHSDVVFGEKYDSWLVALFNAEGELIFTKASRPNLIRLLPEAMALKELDFVDADLKPTSDPSKSD